MAFGIGINTEKGILAERKKRQKEIACECWFTSSGKIIPLLIKYKDEDEIIQTIQNIEVMYMEEKNYSGIPSLEYCCKIMINGLQLEVFLIYYMEKCKWVMLY